MGLVVLAGAAASSACEGSGIAVRLPPECPGDPLGDLPVPAAMPGVLPAEIYADLTVAGVEGVVLDPRPLGRGEHAVERWWLAPNSCTPSGGYYGWGPPPPAVADDTPPAPGEVTPSAGWSRIRALVITGPDPGADDDARRWMTTFDRLGAVAFHVASPGRVALEATIDALCDDVQGAATTLLVTTGRAAHTDAGDAFLIGGSEAISWQQLGERYLLACAGAGLRIWVVDAAFAPPLESLDGAEAAPTMLWRASSEQRPDAPRMTPRGGGLLTLALTERVDNEAGSACLSTQIARTRDLWSAFGDASSVVARMRADRWTRYGEAALQAAVADAGGAPHPHLAQQIAAEITADLPDAPLSLSGGAPAQAACEGDEDCREINIVCSPGACRHFVCTDAGVCRPGPDIDRPCDDGSICTTGDLCDGLGQCRGELVECDDGNACTVDTCVYDAGCVVSPILPGQPCDDGKLCTLADRCNDSGGCVGDLVSCDDGDDCTIDTCHPVEGCVYGAATGPCDDGDACTHQDFCADALCRGAPLPCNDGELCTSSACEANVGCLYPPLPDGLTCDDGDGCTIEDRCASGSCVGTSTVCDDGLECTLDVCEDGGCVHLPAPGTCATSTGCVAVGEPPPGEPCMACVSTGVVMPAPESEGAACPDDGVTCTTDVCQAGTCMHAHVQGFCHDDAGNCVPVGGLIAPCLQCVATGIAAVAEAGAACDDGDPCTHDDGCSSGAICGGTTAACCAPDPPAACGDTMEGDTSTDPKAFAFIDDWSCLSTVTFGSAERSHAFDAPCEGIVTFQFSGAPGLLLFVTPGEVGEPESAEETCAMASCDGYTAGPASRVMSAGQRFQITVDGSFDAAGAYSIEVQCACDEEPAP